jgi:putative protease
MDGIRPGLKLFRNYDHEFVKVLDKSPAERKIVITMVFRETPSGFELEAKDEDGNIANAEVLSEKQPAQKPDAARQTIETQLKKLGNTIFECTDLRLDLSQMYFFPVSTLNAAKRDLVQKLLDARLLSASNRNLRIKNEKCGLYPEKHLTYLGNVLNEKARAFYRKHGVEVIEPAAESGIDLTGQAVMTTKYCLRQQLGLCSGTKAGLAADPLTLIDEQGRSFRLEFRCGDCGMRVYLE